MIDTYGESPEELQGAYFLALVDLRKKGLEASREIFEKLRVALGESAPLHLLFCRADREAGYRKQALNEFQKAVEFEPDSAQVHYELGLTYLLEGQSQKAASHLQIWLRNKSSEQATGPAEATSEEVDKTGNKPEEELGKPLFLKRAIWSPKMTRALSSLLTTYRPRVTMAYQGLGMVDVLRADYPQEERYLERALFWDDSLPDAHYHLGLARFQSGPGITVSLTGFASQVQEVALLVGQSADLTFTLKPAVVAETVTVEALPPPLVESSTATLHEALTPTQVENLPINGRDFTSLATLVPGVTTGNVAVNQNYDPVKRRIPAISVNGQSGRNLNMLIDGGDNTDIFMGGQNIQLSLEAVQEFAVITHDPKAQYARGIGGVVKVVTKSGSNDFHGSGFAFFRDDSLRSTDFFSKKAGAGDPPFDSHQ